MASMLYSVVLLFLASTACSATTTQDCAKYEGDGGYVCVCNSTYCDTIASPTKLKTGKYYHYTTSETSPGFNLKTGKFSSSYELYATNTTDYTVTVDPSVTFQTLKGMGIGFTDSAVYDFDYLSTKAKANLVESYFGSSGIEMVFGRVPIGCTDFSLSTYTFDDTVNDVDMSDFNLTDFEVSKKMPMIQQAVSASSRGLKLLATPWTAPGWMKDNNSTDPGLFLSDYNEAYAKYIIKFFDAYKAKGIDIWGLSEGNEIIMGYQTKFSMPNLIIFPNALREWTRDYLGPMMEEAGYDNVTIITFEDERSYLAWFADRLLSDNNTSQYIDGFAVHWYADTDSNTNVLDDFHTNYPDQMLLMTEASGGAGGMRASRKGDSSDITLGDWTECESFVDDILQNYNHWVESYMTWNFALNLQGGPNTQMALDAPILIDTSNDLFYKQPSFYIFGHFSKFMYPGSVRINVTVEESSSALYGPGPGPMPTGGSFTGGPGPNPTGGPGPNPTGGPGPNPTGGPGPNPTTTPTSSSFNGMASTNPDGSTTVILFNPSSDEVSLTLTDSVKGTIKTTLEANSLNTFIYW